MFQLSSTRTEIMLSDILPDVCRVYHINENHFEYDETFSKFLLIGSKVVFFFAIRESEELFMPQSCMSNIINKKHQFFKK